jgi:hypothetical protein
VGVADGSRGQTTLDQPLVYGLNIERADCRQISGAERGPDISAQQALVAAVAFLPQARLRGGLEPLIEIFVERDLGILYLAAEVAITQHLIKVGLGMADGATDNPAVVAPFAGFVIAPEKDAHQPTVSSPSHDLPGFSGQTRSPSRKIWHTVGTPAAKIALSFQGLGGKEE